MQLKQTLLKSFLSVKKVCFVWVNRDLHNVVWVSPIRQSEEKSQRNKEKNKTIKMLWPWSFAFQTQPPQLPLQLYLSLQLTLNLTQTFCPSLTHSSLTHHPSHYSTVRGQSEGVWGACVCVFDCLSTCACASAIGAVAHQCLTNPLYVFTSVLVVGSQISLRNFSLKLEHLIFHWRNLRSSLHFFNTVMSVTGLDNRWQSSFQHPPLWLSGTQ